MKTQIEIYGETYEIEINARNLCNSRVSKESTEMVIQWFKARLFEAIESAFNNERQFLVDEIIEVLRGLYRIQ